MKHTKTRIAFTASAALLGTLAFSCWGVGWADEPTGNQNISLQNASVATGQQTAMPKLDLEVLYGPNWTLLAQKLDAEALQGRTPTVNDEAAVKSASKSALKTWKAAAVKHSIIYNNGKPVVPAVRLYYDGKTKRVPDSMYSISHSSVSKVGEKGDITISAAWDPTVTCSYTFTVRPAPITRVMARLAGNVSYTGSEVRPKLTLSYNGVALVENRDYTLSYENNINPGTAKIHVQGIGNFTGRGNCRFKISKNEGNLGNDGASNASSKTAANSNSTHKENTSTNSNSKTSSNTTFSNQQKPSNSTVSKPEASPTATPSFTSVQRPGANKTVKLKVKSNTKVELVSRDSAVATVNATGTKIISKHAGKTFIDIYPAKAKQVKSNRLASVKVSVEKQGSRTTALSPWMKAIKIQKKWSAGSEYHWESGGPTIKGSKNTGTCITMPSVSLQRLGMLSSRQYFSGSTDSTASSGWNQIEHSRKLAAKYPAYFEFMTPHRDAPDLVKDETLKVGDIVGITGYLSDRRHWHVMVYAGKDKSGHLVWHTSGSSSNGSLPGNDTALNHRVTHYENGEIGMIVRIKCYDIKTACKNGTVSVLGSRTVKIDKGDKTETVKVEGRRQMAGNDVTVSYKGDPGYVLSSVKVDGKAVNIKKHPSSYVFKSNCEKHTVTVVYKKKK